MAISRSQLVKELEPGLNALFGLEYKRYDSEHEEIFVKETSDRAFEEEVMLSGFGNAAIKAEGSGVNYDQAQETFTARYTHNTIALAFAITEEAIEDNLYDRLASRYTKALARSMANTKQVTAANVLNNGFSTSFLGGDGSPLFSTTHATISGTFRNTLATAADLNETSLEQSLIDIAAFTDERGLKIAAKGMINAAKVMAMTAIDFYNSPATIQKAKEEFIKEFDATLFLFSSKAEFSQKVKLLSKTGFNIKFKVEYMCCNDKMCLPPKTIELIIKTQ